MQNAHIDQQTAEQQSKQPTIWSTNRAQQQQQKYQHPNYNNHNYHDQKHQQQQQQQQQQKKQHQYDLERQQQAYVHEHKRINDDDDEKEQKQHELLLQQQQHHQYELQQLPVCQTVTTHAYSNVKLGRLGQSQSQVANNAPQPSEHSTTNRSENQANSFVSQSTVNVSSTQPLYQNLVYLNPQILHKSEPKFTNVYSTLIPNPFIHNNCIKQPYQPDSIINPNHINTSTNNTNQHPNNHNHLNHNDNNNNNKFDDDKLNTCDPNTSFDKLIRDSKHRLTSDAHSNVTYDSSECIKSTSKANRSFASSSFCSAVAWSPKTTTTTPPTTTKTTTTTTPNHNNLNSTSFESELKSNQSDRLPADCRTSPVASDCPSAGCRRVQHTVRRIGIFYSDLCDVIRSMRPPTSITTHRSSAPMSKSSSTEPLEIKCASVSNDDTVNDMHVDNVSNTLCRSTSLTNVSTDRPVDTIDARAYGRTTNVSTDCSTNDFYPYHPSIDPSSSHMSVNPALIQIPINSHFPDLLRSHLVNTTHAIPITHGLPGNDIMGHFIPTAGPLFERYQARMLNNNNLTANNINANMNPNNHNVNLNNHHPHHHDANNLNSNNCTLNHNNSNGGGGGGGVVGNGVNHGSTANGIGLLTPSINQSSINALNVNSSMCASVANNAVLPLPPLPQLPHCTSPGLPKPCLHCARLGARWFVVIVALIGLLCAILGAYLLCSISKSEQLPLAILLLGIGILLIVISGLTLRIHANQLTTANGHHLNANVRCQSDLERRFLPRPSTVRAQHPYGAMLYPEFEYRPPPPTYAASMQQQRLRHAFRRGLSSRRSCTWTSFLNGLSGFSSLNGLSSLSASNRLNGLSNADQLFNSQHISATSPPPTYQNSSYSSPSGSLRRPPSYRTALRDHKPAPTISQLSVAETVPNVSNIESSRITSDLNVSSTIRPVASELQILAHL